MFHYSKQPYRRLAFEPMEARRVLSSIATLPDAGDGTDFPAPDFQLEDTNTTSPTYGQLVSPRDYTGRISGWYFGFGT